MTATEIDSAPAEARSGFESFFAAHYVQIVRAAARIVRDRSRAEEIAAEAFWRLWRQPATTENTIPLAWLYRTTIRLALDHLKKEGRRRRREALQEHRSTQTPEEQHAIAEERERVRQTVSALDPKQAELLLLRFHGLSYAELAAALRLNPASVGTLLSRAQQSFRKEYLNHE